jgi:hypothetical protein
MAAPNSLKEETNIVWANTGGAGQPQTVRFPRVRGIRSLYFFHDFALDNDTAATEYLSAMEAIDTITLDWGGTTIPGAQEPAHEVNVRGHEIAVTQKAHFGDTPLVGHAAFRDLPVADDQDFDAIYRLPCGASASPQQNITVRVSLAGEVEWSETVADTPADLDTVLYIVADYVDALSVAWDTWDSTTLALAAQTEYQPPCKGNTIFGFSVTCMDDEDDMTADNNADSCNTRQANYEDVLTTVEVEVGEEFIELRNGTPIVNRVRDWIVRRDWNVSAAVISPTDAVDMQGCYWFDMNVLANSLPRIRLNAGTTDMYLLVWYSTPVLAAPTANAQQGAGAIQGEGRPASGQASMSVQTGPTYQPAGQTSFQPVLAQAPPGRGAQGMLGGFISSGGL